MQIGKCILLIRFPRKLGCYRHNKTHDFWEVYLSELLLVVGTAVVQLVNYLNS